MKKIIIAENLLPVFDSNNSIFRRGGITFFTAQSSEEIVKLHAVENADLIIAAQALPPMGAVKLCAAIRSDGMLKKVSIIVTGDNSGENGAAFLEAGANAFIPAPIDAVALFSKVSELLLVPQRKDMRVLLRASVKGQEGDVSFFAASQNISISGMMLETDRSLLPGERLTCSFNIAHSEIKASCMVMRADKASSGRRRYGVNFLNLDTKSLIIIENFVKAQARH
jgi:DNA-binding response OmpR family regulator